MSHYTLTLLDVAGIQDYIFASNVLRENIGASELVRRATRQWPLEEVRRLGKTNVKEGLIIGDTGDLTQAQIQQDDLIAEVIYAGGGNCVILFTQELQAKEFVTRLNLRILAEAPGLDLVVQHISVNWETEPAKSDSLAAKVRAGLDDLTYQKSRRPVSMPLLGVGTTLACQSTGRPAIGTDADEPGLKAKEAEPRALSAEILAKLRVLEEANAYLKRLLPSELFKEANFSIPYDFDDFGRESGEISYIAVVHADGNGMGRRIDQLRSDFARAEQNRDYITAMRAFSNAVELIARQALQALIARLLRHWESNEDEMIVDWLVDDGGQQREIARIVMSRDPDNRRPFLPFRPIVFGGDDLTFVCDGRLGLGLAERSCGGDHSRPA